jgi:Fe-S cluster assembly iron-binding protein IscA
MLNVSPEALTKLKAYLQDNKISSSIRIALTQGG